MPIDRTRRAVTSGTRTSVSQAFFNNYNVNVGTAMVPPFSFYMPEYITYGGITNYTSQDPSSIFTNLINPPIRFVFTAHTESLSGKSYFIHEIYRLDYDTHRLFHDNQITNSPTLSNKSDKAVGDSTGFEAPIKTTGNKVLENTSQIILGGRNIPQPSKFFGEPLTDLDKKTIQTFFTKPVYTITASTTAITSFNYDLPLSQFVKELGSFKTELFLDKAQYFIKTKLAFYLDVIREYQEFQTIDQSTMSGWTDEIKVVTEPSGYTIQNGFYSGITVAGNFFTYFIVPDKPKLEYPILSGQLSTFTPEFRWSNGDKADSFMVQIAYDVSNTGFTGTVANYPIEKSEKNAQVVTNVINDADSQQSTHKTIYTSQIPIRHNSDFIYRVGNSKEMIDAFNVRRNVLTFSDIFSARTQTEDIKTYVLVEVDSGEVGTVSGFVQPPSLDYQTPVGLFTLSGTVSASTGFISGGTASLLAPNNNTLIASFSSAGTYSYTNLTDGTYALSVFYAGYSTEPRTIVVSGNTVSNFKLDIIWGNDYETWGDLGDLGPFI